MTDSCCTGETNTILQSNYLPIKMKYIYVYIYLCVCIYIYIYTYIYIVR